MTEKEVRRAKRKAGQQQKQAAIRQRRQEHQEVNNPFSYRPGCRSLAEVEPVASQQADIDLLLGRTV